jgi:hypothetical protein
MTKSSQENPHTGHCDARIRVPRFRMRFNLVTQPSIQASGIPGALPLSLTLRPACGIQGDYTFPTDSSSLRQLLKNGTDLPDAVVWRFLGEACAKAKARLLGVELSDETLQDIGYFVD